MSKKTWIFWLAILFISWFFLIPGNLVEAKTITIGTSTSDLLDVKGAIQSYGNIKTTNGQICLGNDCKATWAAVSSSSGWSINGTHVYSNVSGNVGIGTSTPGAKLDINYQGAFNPVTPGKTNYGLHFSGQMTSDYASGITWNGGSSGAQAGLYVQGSGVYGTKMYFATTNAYATGAQTRMMLDQYGRVGIGTTNPNKLLTIVNGTISGSGSLEISSSSVPSWIQASSTAIGLNSQSASKLGVWGNQSIGTGYINYPAPTNGLIVEGNVGIGVTSPAHKLELVASATAAGGIGFGTDTELYRSAANTLALASGDSLNLVSGNLQVAGTNVITSSRLILGNNGTVSAPTFSFSADTNTGMYSGGTDILRFSTAGADRMTILANGNVGIGTTAPGAKLDVSGSLKIQSATGNKLIAYNVPILEGGIAGGTRVFRNLANFESNTSVEPGAIVINTGITSPVSAMSIVHLRGYEYSSTVGPGNVIDLDVASYFNGPSWSNRSYVNHGSVIPSNVRIGTNPAGQIVIVVGSTTDNWSYPKLWVESWFQSHSSTADASADNWSISMATDLTGYVLASVEHKGLSLQGGTMSGSLNMQNNLITNIGNANTYFTSSGGLNIAGNVGIGNTNPLAKLDVNGTVKATGLCLGADCRASWEAIGSFWSGASSGNIWSNNTGNVGIGTTNPAAKLDVAGKILFHKSGTANSQYMFNDVGYSITNAFPSQGGNTDWSGVQFNQSFSNGDSHHLGFSIRTDNQATPTYANARIYAWRDGSGVNTNLELGASNNVIITSGNVGIGDTNPSYKLSVLGDISSNSSIKVTNSSGNNWISGNVGIGNASQGSSKLSVNGNQSIGSGYFSSAAPANGLIVEGSVGVGTTNPLNKLDVAGVVNATTGFRVNNTAGTAGNYLRSNGTNFVVSTIQASDIPTLNQNTTGYSNTLNYEDNRTISPSELAANRMKFGFTSYSNNNTSPWADFLHLRSYQDSSGGNDNLLVFNKASLGMRLYQQAWGSTTAYTTYKDVLLSDNSPAINYVTKYTSNGTSVSVGKSIIYDNGTNVGIGTTNPAVKLDIFDSKKPVDVNGYPILGITTGNYYEAGSYNPRYSIGFGGFEGVYYQSEIGFRRTNFNTNDLSGSLFFATADGGNQNAAPIDRMTITNSGNVGIGATNPGQKLEVAGNMIVNNRLTTPANTNLSLTPNGTGNVYFGDAGNGSIIYHYSTSNDGIYSIFNHDASGNYEVSVTGTGMLKFLDNVHVSGNIGIGVTNPGNKLHVDGTTITTGLAFSSNPLDIKTSWSDIVSAGGGNQWITSGNNIYNANSTGNVGIGSNNPSAMLQISRGTEPYVTLPIINVIPESNYGIKLQQYHYGSGYDYYLVQNNASTTDVNLFTFKGGNVGVGTTNPATKLTVWGGLSIGESAPGIIGNARIYKGISPVSVRQEFGTDNSGWQYRIAKNSSGTITDLFTIQDSGNVGIGTTTPNHRLVVSGNSLIDNGNALYFRDNTSYINESGGLNIVAGGSRSLNLAGGTGTDLTILSSGNVGIGTTNPGTRLDINSPFGTIPFRFTQNATELQNPTLALFVTSSSNLGALTAGDNVFRIRALDNNALSFGANNENEMMRIHTDGRVGIGTSAPAQKLSIFGTSLSGTGSQSNIDSFAGNGLRITGNNSGSSQDAIAYQSGGGGGGAAISFGRGDSWGTFMSFYTNSTAGPTGVISERMRITDIGNVGIGTTSPGYKLDVNGSVGAQSFTYNSDARLKKNIKTIKNPLGKILSLRGVTFNWKDSGDASVGLIAQEVEKVFPELVNGTDIKGVEYGNLVAPLIEAVKEQQRMIDKLEARVDILENKANKK